MKDKTIYRSQVIRIMDTYTIGEKDAKKIVDDYIKLHELGITLIEYTKMVIDMNKMGLSASEAGKRLRDVLLGFKQFNIKHAK